MIVTKLKTWMQNNSVTQKQLAVETGYSVSMISHILRNGKPAPAKFLHKLPAVTGGAISTQEIIDTILKQ